MPTYHARSITVRLGSIPLTETTTNNIVLKKGDVAKRQSELTEKSLLHSSYLPEKRVPFPDDPDGFELNWLGNAPFMQVAIDNSSATSLSLTGNGSQDRTAQALALHVELSDRSFQSGLSGKAHLKVEALFNGQLSACSLIHTNDIRSGAKSLHQIFAGYRVDFLAERPWVLLPSFVTADGGTRRFRKTISPLERFKEISGALLKEVEERGTDKGGVSPPSAHFIKALAKMHTPQSILNMQKPGGRKFGVIDVIITAGTGNKLTSGMTYLKRPQRLRDPKYVIRSEIESEDNGTEAGADSLYRVHRTHGVQSQAPGSDFDDHTHVDGDGDTDTHNQRSRKRQALHLAEGSIPHTAQGTSPQLLLADGQIPFFPPPIQNKQQSEISPAAGRVGSRRPSLDHRSDGCKELLLPSVHNRAYHPAREIPQMQKCDSEITRISRDDHFLPASFGLRTPQLPQPHPTTVDISSSAPTIEHAAFNVSSNPSSTFGASPEAQMNSGNNNDFSQPVWSCGNGPTAPSTPFVAPTALYMPTAKTATSKTNWPATPISVGCRYSHPAYLAPQARGQYYHSSPVACNVPNGLPDVLPQTAAYFGYPGPMSLLTPAASSSPVPSMSGSLPPTAMFSVPLKPNRSAPPTKSVDTEPAKPTKPKTELLVRRLVIMGLNGRLIVNHRWKSDQYISVERQLSNNKNGQDPANTSGSESAEPTFKSQIQQQTQLCDEHPLSDCRANSPICGAKAQGLREQRRNKVQARDPSSPTRLLLPYLKRHLGPTNEIIPTNSQIDVLDSIAPLMSASIQATNVQPQLSKLVQKTKSTTAKAQCKSHRHTFTRTSLPGIQGPKAATFLFDDPEEVLREAARMRRSRSPTKLAANPGQSSVSAAARPSKAFDQGDPCGSLPLSGVPSAPLRETPAEVSDTAPMPVVHLPQLDGSSERTSSAASLQGPSPEKTNVSTLAELQQPDPASPQSLIFPVIKKRKFTTRSPIKTPRSPDRLKTVSNPPLNDDCVIAFAESANKNDKRGVLRQVKGERQGVFKEDYVVLAVRFFVPGG